MIMDRPNQEQIIPLYPHQHLRSLTPLHKSVREVRRRPASMHSVEIPMSPSSPILNSIPLPMNRHSIRRPLRSSPLAGPALSSQGLVIEDKDVEGRPKPSRISSTPELSAEITDYEFIPPLPSTSPYSGIVMRPKINHRKSSPPGYLTVYSTSLDSVPSIQTPITPPPSPSKASSRPPSRESTKSLPIPTHVPTMPPNFPRALHRNSTPSPQDNGLWLTQNTFGETPRFSRVSMGTHVVMPLTVKEHRRRSLASVKSTPNLHQASTSPSEAIQRSRSSGDEEDEAAPANGGVGKVISSFADKVRKRTSVIVALTSSSDTLSESLGAESSSLAIMSQSKSGSVTSFSSSGDNCSDLDLFVGSFPRPPQATSLIYSSSKSECGIINEEVEDGHTNSPDATPQLAEASLLPLAEPTGPSNHARSQSASSSKSQNSGFSSLRSRAKTLLRRRKSLVHSRESSNGDPVLDSDTETMVIAHRKHSKGLSFLSFTSSDSEDSNSIPCVPPIPGDNLSCSGSDAGDWEMEAKQVLKDALPTDHDSMVSVVPISSVGDRNALEKQSISSGKYRRTIKPAPLFLDVKESFTAPPLTALSTPPSSSPTSTASTTYHAPLTSPAPMTPLPTPPSPTRPRLRSGKVDQMLLSPRTEGASFNVRPYASASNLELPTSTASFSSLNIPLPSPINSSRSKTNVPIGENLSSLQLTGHISSSVGGVVPPRPQPIKAHSMLSPGEMRAITKRSGSSSSKAMSLLGVGEPGIIPQRPQLTKARSVLGPGDVGVITGPPMTGSTKAMSLLGMGEPGIITRNKSDLHLNTALGFGGVQTGKSNQKGGTIKRFWKNLTGGKEPLNIR